MTFERKSPFDRSFMSSSLIFCNFRFSIAPLCVWVSFLYCSIVSTGPRGSLPALSSNEGSTVLIPPIARRCPCSIVHLLESGHSFRPHRCIQLTCFSPGG